MKSILLIFSLLPLLIFAQSPVEFRAVKITDIDSQVMYTDENIAAAMDYLAGCGINVVLPVVLNGGWTQYQSAIMDSLFGRSIDPDFYGRDPLKRIIIEAHRNGIEVYPWFEYGFASWYSGGTPPYGGHILAKYPEWALRTSDGEICTKNGFDWMSAVNPDVQNFINSLVLEVIQNYDVDGVEFSDRIPAMPIEGGYDSVTVAIYKQEHGGAEPPSYYNDTQWKRWRGDKLNEWYKGVKELVKGENPELFISASPSIYPWGYDNYLQDAQTWIDSNIVDHFIPQLYRYSFTDYLYELNKAIEQVSPGNLHKLFPGILMNIGAGSNAYVMSADYLLSALEANRSKGVMGEAYFFYEGFRKNNNLLGDTLKATYYSEPAMVPERGCFWRPKASIENENGDNSLITGNWETYQMHGFEGLIMRTRERDNLCSVEYSFDVPYSAWYDLYIYSTNNSPWTENAFYTLYGESDSTTYVVDQSDLSRRGWNKLDAVFLESGMKKVLKLDNSMLEDGKYLVADAAMLMINRKKSPEVVVEVKDKDENETIPAGFTLSANYPNPFNPLTTIEFTLSESEFVKIVVYDLLGREVEVVEEGEFNAGRYSSQFDATGLSSGIYICSMQAGGFSENFKMMLMK